MSSITIAEAFELPRGETPSPDVPRRISDLDRTRYEISVTTWKIATGRVGVFPDPATLDDLDLFLAVRDRGIPVRYELAHLEGMDDARLATCLPGRVHGLDRETLEAAYDEWSTYLEEEERETVVSPAAALDDLSLYAAVRLVGIAPTGAPPAIG